MKREKYYCLHIDFKEKDHDKHRSKEHKRKDKKKSKEHKKDKAKDKEKKYIKLRPEKLCLKRGGEHFCKFCKIVLYFCYP